jgi:hypothetical protein
LPFDPAELTADLPPPREDEPSSLRQAIVDELADHLQCAYRRELLTTPGDPAAARQRVLERFGDPVRLARQLWFDALREQIMSQRLTAIAIGLLTLLCVGLFLFTWQSQSAHRVMIEQQQATVQRLMEKLTELANRPEGGPVESRPAEWNHLTIRCVYDRSGGEPAPGVRVKVTPASTNASGLPPIDAVADAAGQIDCGFVLYGQYRLEVRAHDEPYRWHQTISVLPGRDHDMELVCPRPGELAVITPTLQMEPALPFAWADKWWVLYELVAGNTKPPDGQWYAAGQSELIHLVRRPDGEFLASVGEEWLRWEKIEPPPQPEANDLRQYAQAAVTIRGDAPWSNTIRLPPGGYHIRDVTVGVTVEAPTPDVQLLCRLAPPQLSNPRRANYPEQRPAPWPMVRAQLFERKTWTLPLERSHWHNTLLALEWEPGNVVQPLTLQFSSIPEEESDWSRPRERMVVDLWVGTRENPLSRLGLPSSQLPLRPLLRGVRLADPWNPPSRWRSIEYMSAYDRPSEQYPTVRLILRREEAPYVQKALQLPLYVQPVAANAESDRGQLDPELAKELDSFVIEPGRGRTIYAYARWSQDKTEE